MRELINSIAIDKLRHSFVGILLITLYFVTSVLNISEIWALIGSVILAGGNEVYQKVTKSGEPSLLDFLYTMIAPVLVFILIQIL